MKEERDLVNGCIKGNRRSQKKLYDLFAGKMYALCLRYTRCRDDAQDVLQEGFVKVFTKIHLYSFQGSLEGWVRRVIVNTVMEKFRREKKLRFIEDIDNAQTIDSLDEGVVEKLSVDELMELVQQLAPGYRIVFNMYAIEGYGHKEIAEELNITEGTSKSQLARAKKILQDKVEALYSYDRKKAIQ